MSLPAVSHSGRWPVICRLPVPDAALAMSLVTLMLITLVRSLTAGPRCSPSRQNGGFSPSTGQ
jgi:hypothetical protein